MCKTKLLPSLLNNPIRSPSSLISHLPTHFRHPYCRDGQRRQNGTATQNTTITRQTYQEATPIQGGRHRLCHCLTAVIESMQGLVWSILAFGSWTIVHTHHMGQIAHFPSLTLKICFHLIKT